MQEGLEFKLSDDLGITWSENQKLLAQALNDCDHVLFISYKQYGFSTALAGVLVSFGPRETRINVRMFCSSLDSKRRFLNHRLAPLIHRNTIDYKVPFVALDHVIIYFEDKPNTIMDLIVIYDAHDMNSPKEFYEKVVPLMQKTKAKVLMNAWNDSSWIESMKTNTSSFWGIYEVSPPTREFFLTDEKAQKLRKLYATDPEDSVKVLEPIAK